MIQKNANNKSKLGGTVGKLALTVGAAVISAATLATPAFGQVGPASGNAATRPSAATQPARPAGHIVAEGIGADGKVRLMVNKTTILTTTQPYHQVSVAQPEVADVNLLGPNSILVTAKKQGTTQLIVWDDSNKSQTADIVVDMDTEQLQADLNNMFPGSKIQVASMGGSIALRGQVADLKTAEQAMSASSSFAPKVMNFLEVGGGQQVMLQVRFAEVSRRATNALGVNFAATDGIFSVGNNIGNVNPSTFANGGTTGQLATQSVSPSVTLFGSGEVGSIAFRAFLQALRSNNLLRILAEPNLVAMSGQEASFLAGGEFPVPVPQAGAGGGVATITVDYREFGVRLRFVPIVLGDGRIRLKMTPEVSDLDFSSPLVISGSRIPIVNKRTVTTTVELADGQTFAIAGLLDHTVNSSKDVTPLLGDIPVLGALFRSVRYERNETELVVLVTPKLVEPMNPGQVPAVPGESWRHPKEIEIYGKADIGGEDKRPTAPMEQPAKITGTGAAPRFRGSYGFTPPPRATTGAVTE